MPPADVVFITRKWAPARGGMETYSLHLAEELARLLPVDVIALQGRSNGMPPSALALLAFPFTVLRRLLARPARAAVMHVGDMAMWPLGLLAGRATMLVLSAHGTDVSFHRRGGLLGTLYGAYLRLGARLLGRARVIANSRATAQVMAETGWRAHAVVPLATAACPDGVALPLPEPAVLFAGRLIPLKGCSWFIANVLPLLPEGIILKVAGNGWDAGEVAALDHPRVRYLGSLDQAQLAREYASALCVVLPNVAVAEGAYEGFGLVAPEAAAAGGVVLAAEFGGLSDAVVDNETGFLLPSGDAGAWAAAIADVHCWEPQRRTAFVAGAQAKVAEFFSWQRVARATLDAYTGKPAA